MSIYHSIRCQNSEHHYEYTDKSIFYCIQFIWNFRLPSRSRCELLCFWGIMQCVVVIHYRRFGTTYRSHLQESRVLTQKKEVIKFDGSQHTCTNSGTLSYEIQSRTSATHTAQFKGTKENKNTQVDLTVAFLVLQTVELDVQSLASI